MNNERDIIMNTQPYAEDLGIDPSEDWSGWIAVLDESQDDDCYWCIAPKDFWESNHCIPDTSLPRSPKGFFECEEHTLDSSHSLSDQERLLRSYGFEIVQWPND